MHVYRRPPTQSSLVINGVPLDAMDIASYLATTFGRSETEILGNATAESFRVECLPIPNKISTFSLGVAIPPFETCLIARDCVPQEMEDKWFIYLENGYCCFGEAGPA